MFRLTSCLIQAWLLSTFVCMATAKRDEIELHPGHPYNLTVTSGYPEVSRPPSTWLVRAPDDCRILVRFVEFMLQNIDDTLVVGTGSSVRDTSSILARFSGLFPSQSILVPSQRAWLKLNSTSGGALPHRLEIILEAIHHERDVALSDNQTTEISSPGYPHDYPNYADIVWRISAPTQQSVTFRFKDIQIENRYDKITIGVGSDYSDRRNHLAFITSHYNKTDLPTDLIVPGYNKIWLRFQTDNSKAFRGFLIDITAGPDQFEEFQVELGEQQINITSPINIASENYPSPYPEHQNITWYLNPPINKSIRVDVISSHLESKHDIVEISTTSAKDDVLVLTGSLAPRGFSVEYPANESVTIRFESDYSVEYQGFWFRVSAIERENIVTPIPKLESPENFPDTGGSSTDNNDSNGFMIPMLSGIGVAVLLILVSTLIISCYCVRRRRTKPMESGREVLSHLYTTPDTGDIRSPAHIRGRFPDSPSLGIPMVQVSSGSRADVPNGSDSGYLELDNGDEDDYDAVGQATPTGNQPSPSLSHHHYTVASGNPTRHDTAGYCQIEHDYATSLNESVNDYANLEEASVAEPDVGPNVLANKPLYMTKIENNRKARDANTYHTYLPMSASATKTPNGNEPRMPAGSATKDIDLDLKKHTYVNLINNHSSDETTGRQVTTNETVYEVMTSESNNDRVDETVDERVNEVGRGAADTYVVGHRKEQPKHNGMKPKVAPKRKKIKDFKKNSYSNAMYDKYVIS
ncbi:uncharacterized protein LOC121430918 [Lytechinus variegatus]|uniref:uncharacterized protein LOC121430918 n=1 Tax=Lytechinus variegatus TaxID=7654 RepID=UPI001BB2913E|nr:uncharacterized protein LOC121430918 [Lytechinus variegatus]